MSDDPYSQGSRSLPPPRIKPSRPPSSLRPRALTVLGWVGTIFSIIAIAANAVVFIALLPDFRNPLAVGVFAWQVLILLAINVAAVAVGFLLLFASRNILDDSPRALWLMRKYLLCLVILMPISILAQIAFHSSYSAGKNLGLGAIFAAIFFSVLICSIWIMYVYETVNSGESLAWEQYLQQGGASQRLSQSTPALARVGIHPAPVRVVEPKDVAKLGTILGAIVIALNLMSVVLIFGWLAKPRITQPVVAPPLPLPAPSIPAGLKPVGPEVIGEHGLPKETRGAIVGYLGAKSAAANPVFHAPLDRLLQEWGQLIVGPDLHSTDWPVLEPRFRSASHRDLPSFPPTPFDGDNPAYTHGTSVVIRTPTGFLDLAERGSSRFVSDQRGNFIVAQTPTGVWVRVVEGKAKTASFTIEQIVRNPSLPVTPIQASVLKDALLADYPASRYLERLPLQLNSHGGMRLYFNDSHVLWLDAEGRTIWDPVDRTNPETFRVEPAIARPVAAQGLYRWQSSILLVSCLVSLFAGLGLIIAAVKVTRGQPHFAQWISGMSIAIVAATVITVALAHIWAGGIVVYYRHPLPIPALHMLLGLIGVTIAIPAFVVASRMQKVQKGAHVDLLVSA